MLISGALFALPDNGRLNRSDFKELQPVVTINESTIATDNNSEKVPAVHSSGVAALSQSDTVDRAERSGDWVKIEVLETGVTGHIHFTQLLD